MSSDKTINKCKLNDIYFESDCYLAIAYCEFNETADSPPILLCQLLHFSIHTTKRYIANVRLM